MSEYSLRKEQSLSLKTCHDFLSGNDTNVATMFFILSSFIILPLIGVLTNIELPIPKVSFILFILFLISYVIYITIQQTELTLEALQNINEFNWCTEAYNVFLKETTKGSRLKRKHLAHAISLQDKHLNNEIFKQCRDLENKLSCKNS